MISTISYKHSNISVGTSDFKNEALSRSGDEGTRAYLCRYVRGVSFERRSFDIFWEGHDNRLWKSLLLSFEEDIVVRT